MEYSAENKRPTSVMSWIGFGLSLAVFIIILLANIFVFTSMKDSRHDVTAIYMLLFFVCGIIGLLGFIFSIVGLVMAIRNFTPKWMGVSGIIISCLSVVSFFAIPLVASTIYTQSVRIEQPNSIIGNEFDADENFEVEFVLIKGGKVICKVDETKYGYSEKTFNISDKRFKIWIKDNIDSTTQVVIVSDDGLPYSDVTNLMTTLQECGITRFSLTTNRD